MTDEEMIASIEKKYTELLLPGRWQPQQVENS